MKGLSRKVVILTVFILANVSIAGTYSGGSGTTADPYQIGTVADWNELMDTNSDWDANFVMTADINLQSVSLIPIGGLLGGIGINMPFFKGVFDGNGHVIRNAEINMPGYWHIGLFGIIDANSQIRNLGVEDVNMHGERDIAGLVGCNEGTIINCYATGKIGYEPRGPTGANFGGLVGLNYGTITGSHAFCDVNGVMSTPGKIGGLVGWNFGTITDSYAGGTVNGYQSVGGLAGDNDLHYDDVTGEIISGTIARCYATGSVTGFMRIGGLTGTNHSTDGGPMSLWPRIDNCYSTGTVTGSSDTGGLVGRISAGYVTDCYAAGRVTGNGGLIGSVNGPPLLVTNCFWDIEATGQTTSASGTGLTTAEMKTLSTFTSAGWDFVDTWGIGENQTYPFLRTYSGTDLNYDKVVNMTDFAIFADRWLNGTE